MARRTNAFDETVRLARSYVRIADTLERDEPFRLRSRDQALEKAAELFGKACMWSERNRCLRRIDGETKDE